MYIIVRYDNAIFADYGDVGVTATWFPDNSGTIRVFRSRSEAVAALDFVRVYEDARSCEIVEVIDV